MPSAATEKIIDLTEIVEEGHPQTPNLAPVQSFQPMADESLDELDLEKEIDQIFADLDHPEHAESPDASPGAEGPDPLSFDQMLSESAADPAPGPDEQPNTDASGVFHDEAAGSGQDSGLGPDDDFEKLFSKEPQLSAAPQQPTDDSNLKDASLASEPIPETAPLGPDLSADAAPEPEMLHASGETDASVPVPEAGPATEPSPEIDAEAQPATDGYSRSSQQRTGEIHEAADNAGILEPLLQRLQQLEDRLSALEPAERGQDDAGQPDMDGLLADLEQRLDQRFGERAEVLQQKIDSVAEQVQAAAAKETDADSAELVELLAATMEQRLSERLKASEASLLEDLQGKLDALQQEMDPARTEQPTDSRVAELLEERLAILRTELREELLIEIHKAVPLAAARIIREEIQALSQEEENAGEN